PGRRTAARLSGWTAVFALAAGCAPADTASTPADGATRGGAAVRAERPADAPDLLRDAWVSDGRRGWFVDPAGTGDASPFSLYETAWRLRLAALDGGADDTGLRPDRMRRWLEPAERGRLDSSGLPPVAQVDLAVDALDSAGGDADRTTVARTLETLRSGGGYRTAPSADATDPGSTAVAVRVLTRLKLPVPQPVRADALRALRALTPQSAAADPGRAVPVLQTAAALGVGATDRDHAATLAGSTARALSRLGAEPVRLAWEGALRESADRLGARLPAFPPATCDGRVTPDAGIALPGSKSSDPQATYWALKLGCTAVRAPAPGARSRAGWPVPQPGRPGEGALATTAAALVLARAHGGTDAFAGPLTRQLREVWLPLSDGAAPYDTADLAARVNVRLVAGSLGGDAARAVRHDLPAPSLRGIRAGDEARLLLTAFDARDTHAVDTLCAAGSPLRAAGPGTTGGGSVIRAVRLAAAADLCDDPDLRRDAVAAARDARQGPALYRSGKKVSLEASVMGTWVERPRTDAVEAWTRAGLCRDGVCAETPSERARTGQSSLRTRAVLEAARTGDYAALYPVSF
ncbi:hypothetical protein GTW43_14320, partial [Streptomyces sp. SID5785]